MKTSASETRQIDRYLLQQLPPGDKLVFDARLMLCPDLQDTVQWQQQVHQLVKLRGRRQLQAQINAVEQKVFTQPEYSGFRQKLLRLFGGRVCAGFDYPDWRKYWAAGMWVDDLCLLRLVPM